jgi:hypothetical protein
VLFPLAFHLHEQVVHIDFLSGQFKGFFYSQPAVEQPGNECVETVFRKETRLPLQEGIHLRPVECGDNFLLRLLRWDSQDFFGVAFFLQPAKVGVHGSAIRVA